MWNGYIQIPCLVRFRLCLKDEIFRREGPETVSLIAERHASYLAAARRCMHLCQICGTRIVMVVHEGTQGLVSFELLKPL